MGNLLRLVVLGQPRVELAGRKNFSFVSARSQALLLYLAVTKQIHSRESLASLLWPTKPQELARHNLRDALTKLRPFFSDYFTITRQTIGWNLTASHSLDADQLEESIANAGQYSPIEELQDALKLYRGDFLADFFIGESNEFEEWVSEQREKYRKIALRGFSLLLDRLIQQGDTEAAIQVAQRLLTLDALHEEGNRQLLRLLGSSGQRIVALQHYERYAKILEEELGIEPSPEISALHLQLLRGEPLPPLSATALYSTTPYNTTPYNTTQYSTTPGSTGASQPTNVVRIPNNLPRTMTPFLGRKEEIDAISERLSSPHFSLVTIVGQGGMGKSRLALAASEALMPFFEDGVWFVPLAEIQPGPAMESRIAAAIGRTLNLPFVYSESLIDQLFIYLHSRKLLLVLDNFEHLMPASGFVMDLLRAAPHARLLVTSRQRLGFQAESMFRLEGLPTPPRQHLNEQTLDELMAYDGVALFIERAKRVQWRFRLSDSNAIAISRICQYVEGLPLAIELAASLVEMLSPQEINRRLETDYQILNSPVGDLAARQQSIPSLLDYSWQFLNSDEQKALARCSIFGGGFSAFSALQVTDADERTLDALEQKSLLRRNEFGRFDMHELVRQHAAGYLHQHFEDEESILQRHCAYFSQFVFEREAKLGNDAVTFQELSGELANLQQAWQHAVARAKLPQMNQCRRGLFAFYNLSGLSYEAEASLRVAISRVRIVIDEKLFESLPAWQQFLAELLVDLANICEVLGKLTEAEQLTNEAIELANESNNEALLALCYLRASANAWAKGSYELHRESISRSLALAQAAKQFFIEANAFCGLGNNDAMHDRQEEALAFYAQSLLIARDHGYRQLENILVSNAGVLHQLRGNFTQALENFLRSQTVSHELGDRYGTALAQVNLGVLSSILGNHDQALEQLSSALISFQEIGSQRMAADVLVNLALTHYYIGDYVQAIDCCKQAIALDHTHQFRHIDSPAHLNLGRAFEAMGQISAAKSEYQKVLELQTPEGPANDGIIARGGLARLALQEDDLSEAKVLLEEIFPHLQSNELYAGPDETAVCLTTYRVLSALEDERANAVLRQGVADLQQQMENIHDSTLRHTFVANVKVRKELLELAHIT